MRVSTRVEYGILALTDIAMNSKNGESVSTLEISQRQGISKKYLELILPLLRQAGLIKAQKGKAGGYTLNRIPEKITIAEVLNALDTSILEEMDVTEDDGALRSAVDQCLWGNINTYLRDYTGKLTLDKFIQSCSYNMASGWDMYVI